MTKTGCPKCGGAMDCGRVESPLYYKSETQGFFSGGFKVQSARACTQCGYLEFYLNPEKLEKLGDLNTQLA